MINWAELSRASSDLINNIVANSELLGKTAARDFMQLRREAFDVYDATLSDFRDMGAAFRASPRYLRIATLAARVIARHRLAIAREAARPGCGALEAAHTQSAEELREACAELGGGVLKVGQLLSARADLLPVAYIESLRTLQDRAPAKPFEEIESVISEDLGAPATELFAHIEKEAIAAASLAQVHAATLADGRDVVIKVRRPGVAELVRADMRAVRLVASMLKDALPGIDVETTVSEIERFLAEELDFEAEAGKQKRFAAAAGDKRWHVPALIESLCGPRTLVMERSFGRSLSTYLEAAESAEVARVISLLIELLAVQVLKTGLAHGDPHPGNVLVEEDGRLVFVDFGCVLELEPPVRAAYISLVMAIVSRDAPAIATGLAAAGFSADKPEALVALAELFLEGFEPDGLAELDTATQIARALELSREAGSVQVPPSFILIGRIFALVGGLVLHYRPTIDLAPLLAAALR